MPRVTINLEDPSGQSVIKGRWKFATGYIPGEPNEGLIAQGEGSPARLPDYDDSGWEYCAELPARISHGFSFVWYRINITFPDTIGGRNTQGVRAQFETCVDDYGEIWIDGERVADVTTHPAFKPIVDIRARIYDMAHEEEPRDVMS